jgi:hypothetical protein
MNDKVCKIISFSDKTIRSSRKYTYLKKRVLCNLCSSFHLKTNTPHIMKTVYELRGSMSNMEVDPSELMFPNIQTCCAAVINTGYGLIGAHLTMADSSRFANIASTIAAKGVDKSSSAVYLVGALSNYNKADLRNAFKSISNNVFIYDTASLGYVDLNARKSGGVAVAFEHKPAGAYGPFAPISAYAIGPM